MQYSVKMNNDVKEDDDFLSVEEYPCVTTPWRRLCYALGQCWQDHNSCLGTLDLHDSCIPRRKTYDDDYEDSTRTALLSDEDLHYNHNMQYHQPNDIRWDRPLEPMFQDNALLPSSQTVMDQGGIVFMAPLSSSSQNRQSKPALTRKIRAHWKLQRRMMLPFPITANSSRRAIPLHDDDDCYDEDGFSSVVETSLSIGGKQNKRNVQHQHRHHDHLLVENYWPYRETIKPLVQPRSASAFDNVLTVGSSSAVECLMIPPEPSLRSNPGDSCSSSLSSKEEFTRFDSSFPAPNVTNTKEITSIPIQTRIFTPAFPEEEEDDDVSSGRNATSKLYPQSLTRSMTAPAAPPKSSTATWLPRSRTAPAGPKPLVANSRNSTNKLQAQDDRDDDRSTGGSCYSIPTLTVSYEDDAAQLAIAFSSSLRDDTDSEYEDDEEELDEEGRPLVPQTMGLHCFTLGANFSHPAAAWTQPVRQSSLAPPPPSSPTSSVGSTSSKSMSDASQKRGRKIGISFPHPWYSSKLLHVPKRDIPQQQRVQPQQQVHQEQPQQQRQVHQEPLAKDGGELYHYQQQRNRQLQRHHQQQRYQQQRYHHQQRQQDYRNMKENSFVEERDDVWSMVESDPMDGDMTDPPTPVPIQTSKVWSPDNLGWSSSDDDVGEAQFDTSTPSSWRWPKHAVQTTYRDKASHSSRSWEELPEDDDGFIVRKPTMGSKRMVNGSLGHRLEAQALLAKRDGRATREVERTKTTMYSKRLAYPPLQPLFMNT